MSDIPSTNTALEPPAVGFSARLKAHIDISRIDHWTKNVFVLPGILIPLRVHSVSDSTSFRELSYRIGLGLLSVCLIASSNYVLNELLDAPFDRLHPVKRFRPAAVGLVNVPLAYVQWLLLMVAGLGLALAVSKYLAITMLALWIMGCIYNIPPVRSKDLPYVDVLSESINNPLRMLAGWYMVTEQLVPPVSILVSYWMIGAYFMALKRFSEFREIGDQARAARYRRSFDYYSERSLLVSVVFYASASMLFFGAFSMRYHMELVLAFPVIALVMAIYCNLAFEPNSAVQNPELLYRQRSLMIAVVFCAALMLVLLWTVIPDLRRIFSPTFMD
jgi:decaprenyl-phosphate phosphoribosyltransferase